MEEERKKVYKTEMREERFAPNFDDARRGLAFFKANCRNWQITIMAKKKEDETVSWPGISLAKEQQLSFSACHEVQGPLDAHTILF